MLKNINLQLILQGEEPPQLPDYLKEAIDKGSLSDIERNTLQAAIAIGLIDKQTREKLLKDAKAGDLTDYQLNQIKMVQEGLSEDGKYTAEIDGLFGVKSLEALIELAKENDRFDISKKVLISIIELGTLPRNEPNKLHIEGGVKDEAKQLIQNAHDFIKRAEIDLGIRQPHLPEPTVNNPEKEL